MDWKKLERHILFQHLKPLALGQQKIETAKKYRGVRLRTDGK